MIQHKFIAMDGGNAALLRINERDQPKNWMHWTAYGRTLRFTGAMIDVRAQDLNGMHAVVDFDYFDHQPAKS